MAVGWPVIEQIFMPRYEAQTIVRLEWRPGSTLSSNFQQRFQAALDKAGDQLKSPEGLNTIKGQPAITALPKPPTTAHLERCVRQRLRITAIPNTFLAYCSLVCDDPESDVAILNAATSSLLNHLGEPAVIVSVARPPRSPPPSRYPQLRGFLGAIVSVIALALILALLLAAKAIRILRIPDEIAPTARQEFVETLSDILVTPIQAPEPESTLNFADNPVLATFPAP
jgi:hypothetical protein